MAQTPRHGSRPQAKSPSTPPAQRSGRKKPQTKTRRKSRFEQLEERQVLTALFTPGDLVVTQINATGNTVTPTSTASPVFLSEFSPSVANQSTYVQQVALPTVVSGSNNPLTISGTAASEGSLSLSANGEYLVVAGYDQTVGGKTQLNSTVGLVDANGDVNTTTTSSQLSGNNTRGAASVDGTSVWIGGANGTVYETTGTVQTGANTGGTLIDTKPSARSMQIVPAAVSPESVSGNGVNALLAVSSSASTMGVDEYLESSTVTALPTTTGTTNAALNGMTSANSPSPFAFFFANSTTMFVADSTDGIQEWTLSGSTWSVANTLTGNYVGLTGVVNPGSGGSPSTVSLYATTGNASGRTNDNNLVSDLFTFDSGSTGHGTFAATPTVLATSGTDYGFGGVAFAPQVANVNLVVTASPSSLTAGGMVTATVTAQYATGPDAGQTDAGYTGTVAFTSSDPQAVLPSNYMFTGSGGVMTFPVTLKTAGSETITATDTSTDSYGTATVSVTPSTLSKLAVSAPVDATAGIAFSVTVTAEDQYNNTIPGYTGTVSFSGGGTGASLPSTYTFVAGDNGSHTFTNGATLTTAAGSGLGTNQTISATDSGHSINGSAVVDDYAVSPFTPNVGDFVVYRVGTGSTNLGGDSVPVYLDEYAPPVAPSTQATLIETVPLPVTSTSQGNPLTGEGNALSEGQLSLSPNGEYLALTGYDTGINYSTPSGCGEHRRASHGWHRRSDGERQHDDRTDRLLVGR